MKFTWVILGCLCISTISAANDRTATIVVLPDAAQKVVEVGQDSIVGFDVMIGKDVPVSLRMQVYPHTAEKYRVAVEAFVQERFVASSHFGDMADTLGIGGRIELPLLSDGENDALIASPGINFVLALGNEHGLYDGWFRYGPPENIYFVATNVDLIWLHKNRGTTGFYIGTRFGSLIGLHGRDLQAKDVIGRLFPEVGVFGGVRY